MADTFENNESLFMYLILIRQHKEISTYPSINNLKKELKSSFFFKYIKIVLVLNFYYWKINYKQKFMHKIFIKSKIANVINRNKR